MHVVGDLRVVTPASALPVTVADAKAFARITTADDDDFIEALIRTAREWLQPSAGWLGRSVAPVSLRYDLPCWPSRAIRLPAPPVTAVSSVKFFDSVNIENTLSSSLYFVDEDVLVFKDEFSAPTLYQRPGAVRIAYTAGYAEDALPEPIAHAIKMLVLHWYENREAVATVGALSLIPVGVQDLLSPYRLV